jgi:hypothetical protein
MTTQSETYHIRLTPIDRAEITVTIVEEPLPVPLETEHRRPPTARELHQITQALIDRAYTFTP